MQGALVITVEGGRARFDLPAPLPLDALMRGRPVGEAIALMPRLFNLCAVAQGAALRVALGLPAENPAGLARDILRDHVMKLCLRWPSLLAVKGIPLPAGWAMDEAATRRMLLGRADTPLMPQDFAAWLQGDAGVAPVLRAIRLAFAPGEAVSVLPLVTGSTALAKMAQENSPAARQSGHAVLRDIEAALGRGPFWHAVARLMDALACLDGSIPAATLVAKGTAIAPAARGIYAVRAQAVAGRIVRFERCTPTDHLTASGGTLQQALASLHRPTTGRVTLLADILDPCVDVRVRERAHA